MPNSSHTKRPNGISVSSKRLFCIAKLLIFCCLTSSALAGNYFIDFVGGNDGNSGIDKAHPWKRAPNMANWGGTYTPAHGDRFFFKGGVTWPAAAFPWTITSGGTAPPGPYPTDVSTYNYYGVDKTWFTGGSWTQPLFDFQSHQLSFGVKVSTTYVVIDNIEMKGLMGSNNAFLIDCSPPGGYVSVANCYLHDCPPSISTNDNAPIFVQSGFSPAAPGIDVVGTEMHQLNTFKSGIACRNTTSVRNCHIHDMPNAILAFGTISGCHIHNIGPATARQPNGDVVHANAIETFQAGPALISGNLIHDLDNTCTPLSIGGGVADFNGASGTVINNVFYNTGIQSVGNDSRGGGGANFLKYYNNTFVGVSNVGCDHGTILCEERNNQFIATNQTNGTSIGTFINDHPLIETLAQATAAGYVSGTAYAPTSGSAPTVDTGVTVASVTTDRLGAARPQNSVYDRGAYEWGGVAPSPSATPTPVPTASLSISPAAINFGSVPVNGSKTVTATVTNSGNASGTTVFGLSAPFSATDVTVAAGGSQSVTFHYDPTVKANDSATATVGSSSASLTGIAFPNLGTLNPSLTVNANAGILTAPFTDHAGDVYQTSETDDPTQGGRLSFGFTVSTAGQYKISGLMNCPDGGTNSFFINVDGEPTAPTMISDIVNVTTGFESRDFPWRGNGGFDTPQFNPNLFTLGTGDHEVIIRGREANAKLETLTISPLATPPPALTLRMTNLTSGGTAPFVVSPIVSTSGGVGTISIDYNWGDGTSHTAPPHTYSAAGVYPLVVTATDSYSPAQTATVQATITVDSVPLTGSDTPSTTSGSAVLNVTFTGAASGGVAPYTFTRTFGDGATSMAQSPTHGYTTAGVYTETLNIQDSATPTPHTYTVQNTITVSGTPPLVLSFSASPSSGTVPFTSTFTPSVSGGSGTGYTFLYSFNDGAIPGTSTLSSPSRNYTVAGIYSVGLTATDSLGNSQTKNISVQAIAPAPTLNASISADPPSGPAPLTTRITVNVSGVGYTLPFTYSIDFGDGSPVSTDPAPTHTYTGTDQFNISATVTDANGLSASATGHVVTSLPASPTALIRIR